MFTLLRSASTPVRIWGSVLIVLAPVVSAVQYIATRHLYYWAGVGPLLSGVFLIVLHRFLARSWASRASRPVSTVFRERSIVVQIVSILMVFGFFGVRLWDFWDRPSLSSAGASAIMVFALIGVTICMIIINIAGHIAIAFSGRPETLDERDRLIGLRGSRNAYGVLAMGIWFVLYLAIAGVSHGALLYAIMGAFALAELVRLGSQLLYYKLGA